MASNKKSPGMLMHNAGIFNPVLVQAVGLCPVVAMATSLRSAALLAVVSAVIVTLSEFIASYNYSIEGDKLTLTEREFANKFVFTRVE